ncbi:MAG: branched-chain amino acid ABC transporter permease, partial [Gammaproteobacteria bacterium]|nr:branched-chain amino acid ABC transporter permease [Gammaproteobacteria bacterium]
MTSFRRLRGFLAFAVAVALLPVFFPDNYFVTVVGVTIGFNIVLAVGLNLFIGYAGQISLGHAAFFGMGAYASAILTTRYGWSPWLAMAFGLAVVYVVATVISRPILKLKGHYLAMATLGFGIIVNIIMVQATNWTGGPDGMGGIPSLSLFGHVIDSDLEWYAVMTVVVLATVLVSLNIIDSRAGRALRAVHGSEVAAQTMGVDTARTKSQIFVFSAL